jgi:hypothetical protein
MKKLLLLTLFASSFQFSNAQCVETAENKILMIGDSWAFFMHTDQTFNNVLDQWGMTQYRYYSNAILAVNGARTEDFLEDARLNEIENQLNSQPSIEAVHISLGGNDFLGDWNVDFTPEETEALSDETFDEIETLIAFIREVRPGIQIVFSGYMYANFEEVINDAAPFEESHPFYGNWEDMGFPNFEELNTLLNGFSDRMEDYAAEEEGIDYVNVPALMQRIYGQESPLGVDPGGTYPVDFQPLPYGDITYPSPKVSMRNYGITRDCFHLSAEGYYYMIGYQFQKFYHKFLMDDAFILADEITKNGSVNAIGEVSETLALGGEGLDEHQLVLSFYTLSVPDTILDKAYIYLRRDSVWTDSPIGDTVSVSMVNGALGTDTNVNPEDFNEIGEVNLTACIFGDDGVDGNWIRIELPEEMVAALGNAGDVQFLIKSPALGESIFFSGTDDPEFAPVLNLKYKSEFIGLEEFIEEKKTTAFVYPNPTTGQLFFHGVDMADYSNYQIFDLQGRLVMQGALTGSNFIDLNPIEQGHYLVRLTNGTIAEQFTVVKQ